MCKSCKSFRATGALISADVAPKFFQYLSSWPEEKVTIIGYSGVRNSSGQFIKQDPNLNYVFLVYFFKNDKFLYYSLIEDSTLFVIYFKKYYGEVDMDQFNGCAKNLDENFDLFASRVAKQKTKDYLDNPNIFNKGETFSKKMFKLQIPKSFEIKGLLKGMFNNTVEDMMMIKEREFLTKLFTKSMFKKTETVASRLLDPGYEYLFLIKKTGLESISNFLPIAESRLNFTFEKLRRAVTFGNEVFSTLPLKIGNKNGRDLFVQSSYKDPNSGFGIVFSKLDDGRHVELWDSAFLVLANITESNIKVYNSFDEITGVIKNDTVIVRDFSRYNVINNDFSVEFQVNLVNETLVENLCTFESNSLLKCPRITQLKKDKNHLKKMYKKILKETPEAIKDKVTSTLTNYVFPDEETRISLVRMSSENLDLGLFVENKLDEPEMHYKIRYSPVLDRTNITIKSDFERIDQLYDPDELKIIRSNVYMQNVRQHFAQSKANYYVTYEDYFALRNFNREEWNKWNADSGKRIKYALYRLGIRQFDDPSYTHELYYNLIEFLPREYFLKNFVSKVSSTFELKKFVTAYKTKQPIPNRVETDDNNDVSVNIKIIFHEKYFKADLSRVFKNNQGKVVLFPGCKFDILVVKRNSRNSAEIIMRYLHNNGPQYQWLKTALSKVNKYKNSNTRFSVEDPPEKIY